MPRSKGIRTTRQTSVRIDAADKAVLDKLAASTGESTPKLLHRALDHLKRKMFCQQVNETYRKIREEDPELWAEIQAEDALLDGASGDGLQGLT